MQTVWHLLPFTIVPLYVVLILVNRFNLKPRQIVALLLCALVFPVAYLISYPSAKTIAMKERLLFATEADEIDAIVLAPAHFPVPDDLARRLVINIVQQEVVLQDREAVAEIIEALHTATPFSPNHPGGRRQCLLTIESGDDSVTVHISNTQHKSNGVLIYVRSNRQGGWRLGNYRCDALGPILETHSQ